MRRDKQTRFVDWGDAHSCALSTMALLALTLITIGARGTHFVNVKAYEITLLFVLMISISVLTHWLTARDEGRLPAKRANVAEDGKPRYRHISGSAAAGIIGFVVLISAISAWASNQSARPNIDGLVGIGVIALLLIVFLWFAFRTYKPGRQANKQATANQGLLLWLSRGFSIVDSLLVFSVANAVGMRLDAPWRRFIILLGSLLSCLVLSWYLPTPYSFAPIFWAVVSVIAIARQWSWVENDREVAMLKRTFDAKDLRVGFDQDLRDEALVGFAILLLLTPVALRAVFLGFETSLDYAPQDNGNIDLENHSYWVWLSLFGTELAKAVPFVDWAEIFQVEGDPFIVFDRTNPVYQCTIFAMRVMVDLVLLAALVQAVSIVSRTVKQKEMFYEDGTLSQLDPFIEPIELAHLVAGRSGHWRIRDEGEFEAFPEYDEDRLVRLSLPDSGEDSDTRPGEELDAVRFIARKLAERDEQRPYEQLLVIQVKKERLNEERIDGLLEQLEVQSGPIAIESLIRAHSILNEKNRMRETRIRITRILVLNVMDPRAVMGLSQILTGLGAKRVERHVEVREIAYSGLVHPAITGNAIARSAIALASAKDNAPRLKEQASALIDRNEHWLNGTDTDQPVKPKDELV